MAEENWKDYFSTAREEPKAEEETQPPQPELSPKERRAQDDWTRRFSRYDAVSGEPKIVSQDTRAKDLADYYKDNAWGGVEGMGYGALETFLGVKQRADEVSEYLGFTPRGQAALNTEAGSQTLSEFWDSDKGQDPNARMGGFVGEMASLGPLLGGPVRAATRWPAVKRLYEQKSFAAGVARPAASGGVAGFVQFVEADQLYNDSDGIGQKAWNSIIGASMGAGIGSIHQLTHIGQNFAWKLFNDMRQRNPKAVDEGLSLEKQFDLKLDPFQLYPTAYSDAARKAMQSSPEIGHRLDVVEERNLKNFQARFENNIDKAFMLKLRSPEQGARLLHETWMQSRNGLVMHRKNTWNRHMGDATRLVGKKKFIPVANLRQTLGEIHSELTGPFVPEDLAKIAPGINKLIKETRIRDEKGRITGNALLSVEEFQRVLARYGDLAFAKRGAADSVTEVRDHNYKRIYDALKKDLDALLESPPSGVKGQAIVSLKAARDSWRQNSDRITDMDMTAAAKFLGKDKFNDVNPKDIINEIPKMSPGQIANMSQVMDSVDPQIMEGVRGLVLRNALDKSMHVSPKNAIQNTLDPARLWEELPKGKHFEALFPDPAMRKQFEGAINAASRLALGPGQKSGQLLEFYQNTFANVSTMSPTFLAIQFAKLLVPERLWRMLMTETGRRGLMQLTTSRTPSQFANAMAVVFTDEELMEMAQQGLPESEIDKMESDLTMVERFQRAQGQ